MNDIHDMDEKKDKDDAHSMKGKGGENDNNASLGLNVGLSADNQLLLEALHSLVDEQTEKDNDQVEGIK